MQPKGWWREDGARLRWMRTGGRGGPSRAGAMWGASGAELLADGSDGALDGSRMRLGRVGSCRWFSGEKKRR
ncbi:DNA-helicase PcrA [Sesbania bispinosa]|nr:DNA-helicase PcrA [Sesbania bispinosa]